MASHRSEPPSSPRTEASFTISDDRRWLSPLKARIDRELAKVAKTPLFEASRCRERDLDLELRKRRETLTAQRARIALPAHTSTLISQALGRGEEEILISRFNIDFCGRDLQRLRAPNWLNDETINFYLQLIAERAEKRKLHLPSVHVFSSFFLPKLRERGYEAVRTATRRLATSVLERQLIFVPVHLGMHWCMAVIDLDQRSLYYYDSLHGGDNGVLRVLRAWLDSESRDKLGRPFDFGGWRNVLSSDIPAQHNSYDCGVFSLVYAEHHSRRVPFTFSQKDMLYWRDRISYEILTGLLLEGA